MQSKGTAGKRLTRVCTYAADDVANLFESHVPHPQAGRDDRQRGKQQPEPPDGDPVEPARALNHPPAGNRGADAADHARHEQRAAHRGAEAVHGLEVQRQEEEGAHLARHAEEVGHVARKHAPLKDDAPGCEGVRGHARLDVEEHAEGEWRGDAEGENGAEMRPAYLGAGIEAKKQREDGGDESQGAEEVDALNLGPKVVGGWRGQVERKVDDEGGNDTERRLSDK